MSADDAPVEQATAAPGEKRNVGHEHRWNVHTTLSGQPYRVVCEQCGEHHEVQA